MKYLKFIALKSCFMMLLTISVPFTSTVQASDAGAFIGGMVATRVLTNMTERTRAEQQQAYYASQNAQKQQARQAAPASATVASSTQQKLDQLDKLAAGGYITKDEYQSRRKALLDNM